MAGQGRGRGLGGQQSAATPADLGAESGDGGNQVLHHQRSETDWRSPCAVGRVRALERGACVPRREKRNRSDPFRRAQLCVVETSFGVVPGSNGLRQFAHDADPGGKIRRSPWSKSAEPWFSPVGNICAAYERRLKPIAWSTCSSTINFETPPPPALGKNAHDGSNVSLRCSVSLLAWLLIRWWLGVLIFIVAAPLGAIAHIGAFVAIRALFRRRYQMENMPSKARFPKSAEKLERFCDDIVHPFFARNGIVEAQPEI